MASGTNPTVPKRQLGRALMELREAAGKERDEIADLLECDPTKILRIEKGQVGVRAVELRVILDLYGVKGRERAELEDLARDSRKRRPRTTYGKAIPDWFRRYVSLEETASEIRTYDGELITGLLQTEKYARAVTEVSQLHRPGEIDQIVKARAARQSRLFNDDPPQVWAIMSEGVIRLQVGGREVTREQLGHLLELAKLHNVTLQVTPFEAGAHPATGFGFTLLRFPDDVGVDVVYLEDLTSASYLDKLEDAHRQFYATTFSHLSAAALSPTKSTKFIDNVRREL